MRIGIDCRLWNETGVGRYIRSLVGNLGKIKSSHTYVLFLRGHDYETFLLPSSQFEKIAADVSWHSVEEQLRMPSIYRKAQVDLIHVPYFSVPLFTPKPFVVTIHDLTISHFATGKATTKPLPLYLLKRLGYKIILSNAVKRATSIITVSETIKKQILEEYPVSPGKIYVTYESGELSETDSSNTETVEKGPYLLYVGNAHPHKNLENLIEAYALLQKKLPNLKLVLVGKLDYFYQRLKRFVSQKRLTKTIIFPGEIHNHELPHWYQSAQAFVFPSLSEGFGIPGLEAMNNSCPVLASDLSIFHEIYGEAALYFNPKDREQMASVMLKPLTDEKLRKRLIESGKKKVKEYSWKKMTEETLAIYENALKD